MGSYNDIHRAETSEKEKLLSQKVEVVASLNLDIEQTLKDNFDARRQAEIWKV